MSAQAKARDAEVRKAETELGGLNSDLKLDLLQAGVDAAGVIDPTPVSDLVGAGISVYRGDFVGAGLSLISIIPYAGDAIGKTAKGAKLLAKMNALRKRIALATERINTLRKQAREAASAATRAKSQARAARKGVDDAMVQKCAKELDVGDNPFGTRTPATGWSPGTTRGDGPWTPDAGSSYGKSVLEWQKKNGMESGTPIVFRQGFPDFSPYSKHQAKIDMLGDYKRDFEMADAGMQKRYPGWERPTDMTWHHSEDGVTMLLVPKDINSIPHTGGNALAREPGF